VAVVIFFPIFWVVLTSFKTEKDAFAQPPKIVFQPTLENYVAVQERADYLKSVANSIIISFGSTLIGLALAVPAAFSMVFNASKRTDFTLLWMLSTKMLPSIGVLVPIYLIFRDLGLLDTLTGLLAIHTLINLPIMVWMLYTYFHDIPRDMIDAARIDGAKTFALFRYILLPTSAPAIGATALLSIILSWNEAFWSINLTTSQAAPLTAFIASFSSPEGLFFAKLSAASTLAIAPIIIFGWLTQKQLVRGLTFGAVK